VINKPAGLGCSPRRRVIVPAPSGQCLGSTIAQGFRAIGGEQRPRGVSTGWTRRTMDAWWPRTMTRRTMYFGPTIGRREVTNLPLALVREAATHERVIGAADRSSPGAAQKDDRGGRRALACGEDGAPLLGEVPAGTLVSALCTPAARTRSAASQAPLHPVLGTSPMENAPALVGRCACLGRPSAHGTPTDGHPVQF